MASNDFTEEDRGDVKEDIEEEGTKYFCDGPGKMKSLTSRPDETFTMDTGKWIILFASSNISNATVEEWISKHSPSKLSTEDSRGTWISIVNSHGRKFKAEREDDVDGLLESWEELKKSGRPINYANVKELALRNNVLSGKWMFFCSAGSEVDSLWSMVAKGIVGDSSGPCYSAKVGTFDCSRSRDFKDYNHSICIYNKNFTNLNQVRQSEQAIRRMGIKCELKYKPDVFTYLGVYSRTHKELRPTIMRSIYDISQGRFLIKYHVPV